MPLRNSAVELNNVANTSPPENWLYSGVSDVFSCAVSQCKHPASDTHVDSGASKPLARITQIRTRVSTPLMTTEKSTWVVDAGAITTKGVYWPEAVRDGEEMFRPFSVCSATSSASCRREYAFVKSTMSPASNTSGNEYTRLMAWSISSFKPELKLIHCVSAAAAVGSRLSEP